MDRAVRRRTGNGLSLFIALARMVTFCKEGDGMLSVWTLRTRSYKTKAESYQQGQRHPSSPRGLFGFMSCFQREAQKFKGSRSRSVQSVESVVERKKPEDRLLTGP